MTKEQKAQQAQAIKRYTCEIDMDCIRDVETEDGDFVMYSDHKAIVDPQTQTIADQATVIEEMHAHTVTLNALYLQAEEKIAEQAKEIERLKDLVRKTSGVEPGAIECDNNAADFVSQGEIVL